jgi:hypothetical protein
MEQDKAIASGDVTEEKDRDLATAAETTRRLASRHKSVISTRPGSVY